MLNYAEISETVEGLHNSFSEVRTTAERRYSLYQMRKEPYVPDEIAREGKVRMLSPLLIYAAQTIRADLMMNPTELTVIPLARDKGGAVTKKATEKAENLERAGLIRTAKLRPDIEQRQFHLRSLLSVNALPGCVSNGHGASLLTILRFVHVGHPSAGNANHVSNVHRPAMLMLYLVAIFLRLALPQKPLARVYADSPVVRV